MTASYLTEPSWAQAVLGVTVALFVVGEVVQATRLRRDATVTSVGGEVAIRVVLLAGVLILPTARALFPGADIGGGVVVFLAGAGAGWAGLLLRWWSFATLGRYFTTVVVTAEDQPVIDRGPYRVLRHPSYTGFLLAFAGCGVMLDNWVGAVAATGLVLAGLVLRLLTEERAMADALGDSYTRFAQGRARLVPFVW